MVFAVPVSRYPLLQDPPFAIFIVWLAAAIGYRVLRVLRAALDSVPPLELGVLSAAIGFGLLQYLAYTLGMLGRLTPTALRIALIALTILFSLDMLRVGRGVWRALAGWRSSTPGWMKLGVLILAVPLAAAFLLALCPPFDSDGVGYHLAAPKRWLQSGDLRYLPTMTHTESPMGVEMLYTLALALWSDTAAKLIHFTFGLLALLAIFSLGKRLRNEMAGFLAAALFLFVAPQHLVLNLFSWAYVDLGITFEVVCAVLAWCLWRQQRNRAWFVCSAFCAGFAASFKLTGLFLSLVLSLLVLLAIRQDRGTWRVAVKEAAIFFGLALLPVLPWFYRAWQQTGDPVFPLLPSVFPMARWSPEAVKAYEMYFKYYNWGTGFASSLTLEQRIVLRAGLMLIVAAIGCLLVWWWKEREPRAIVLVTTAAILASLATTGLYLRFLVPEFALIYVLLGVAVGSRLQSTRWASALMLVILGGLSLVNARAASPPQTLQAAIGRMPREEYLATRFTIAPLWTYANRTLPKGSRILCLGSIAAYYMDSECYVTEPIKQKDIRFDTWAHFLNDLRQQRIEYVIVADGVYNDSVAEIEGEAGRNRLIFARRLLQGIDRPLFSVADLHLYRLPALPGA